MNWSVLYNLKYLVNVLIQLPYMFCCILQDDEDVYILSKISDVIHSLSGTYKIDFAPKFEQLLPYFVKLIVSITTICIIIVIYI